MATQQNIFGVKEAVRGGVVNVASVPQRSPFRYPGGKTWLVPYIRLWLRQEAGSKHLVEPFAGGGIVSLSAAFEELAQQITMCELDPEVAAVWETIFSEDNEWLAHKIFNFELTLNNINQELNQPQKTTRDVAFCTLLKNRVNHGGILAKGSGMIKSGENGKGLLSRWYPKTLRDRILAIGYIHNNIAFLQQDAFVVMPAYRDDDNAFFFIDPPYTLAGKRLYTYYDIDHDALFALVSTLRGRYLMTYDESADVVRLAEKYKLSYMTIDMKTTHHLIKREILISDSFDWLK